VNQYDPSPLRLAIVVDEACIRIFDAWEAGARVTALRVSPAVYEAVAAARPGEVRRGYPLMLLGMELVPDAGVETYEPAVVASQDSRNQQGVSRN
jgi:hypothetical protein